MYPNSFSLKTPQIIFILLHFFGMNSSQNNIMIIMMTLEFFQQYTASDADKIYHPSNVIEWKAKMDKVDYE